MITDPVTESNNPHLPVICGELAELIGDRAARDIINRMNTMKPEDILVFRNNLYQIMKAIR